MCKICILTCHLSHKCLQEKRLQLCCFDGTLVREWLMDAVVRYIKVAGGAPGKEGLLVGLKSGAIMKIHIDNAFPIPLIKHTSSIRQAVQVLTVLVFSAILALLVCLLCCDAAAAIASVAHCRPASCWC